ncbi:MAG: hypothetical protein HC844_16275 [Tabrizicola sp.]|nr:hypothetical protein [Tabrizicola sp.]
MRDLLAFRAVPKNGRNLPNRPNLERVDSYADANGTVVELWAPRAHQFTTDANGNTVAKETKPVVSVNGQVIEPSTMYIGASPVDGMPIIGFEYLDPVTGKVTTVFMPIENSDPTKAKNAVTTMANAFDASGNLHYTDEILQEPALPAFDALLRFEEDRAAKILPPPTAAQQQEDEAVVTSVLTAPEVQSGIDAQEQKLVKDGVMLDGEAMEALGYIPEGQSEPGQVYFVEKSPALQAGMTELGMGDMNKDVVHTVPMRNKGRTLTKVSVGGRIGAPGSTEIVTYEARHPNGGFPIKVQAQVKYASVPIPVKGANPGPVGGANLPVGPNVFGEGQWSSDEGFDRGALTLSGEVSSVVDVRAGIVKPGNVPGNVIGYEHTVWLEGEAGLAADGRVSFGRNLAAGNGTVTTSALGRPMWGGGNLRYSIEYTYAADRVLPAWMQGLMRATGHRPPVVTVGVDFKVAVTKEADGSNSLRVEAAPSISSTVPVHSLSTRAQGVGGVAHNFLRWAFAYAGGIPGRAAGHVIGGGGNDARGMMGRAVGEALSLGGSSFMLSSFDSVFGPGDVANLRDVDGDGELEERVSIADSNAATDGTSAASAVPARNLVPPKILMATGTSIGTMSTRLLRRARFWRTQSLPRSTPK